MLRDLSDRVHHHGEHHCCCKEERWEFQILYRLHRLEHGNHRIDELLEEINGGSSFSKFVLASGYHQIAIAEEYVWNADFRYGYYEFVVMSFGSTKAPLYS